MSCLAFGGSVASWFHVANQNAPLDAATLQAAGRTGEAIPHLAKASAANPKDTLLSLKVAALQAWFGQEKELAATRQRILAFAKDTKEAITAERAPRLAVSCHPPTRRNSKQRSLWVARGRNSVRLGSWESGTCWPSEWPNTAAVTMPPPRRPCSLPRRPARTTPRHGHRGVLPGDEPVPTREEHRSEAISPRKRQVARSRIITGRRIFGSLPGSAELCYVTKKLHNHQCARPSGKARHASDRHQPRCSDS